MSTLTKDFNIEHARGGSPKLKFVSKVGENGDLDTGTLPETIWTQGGVWVPPTQARVHDVASTDAADDAGGTGAQQVRLSGLDENFDEIDVTLDMTGLIPVQTPLMQRVHKIAVTRAGAGRTNAGVITATAQIDATVTEAVAVGDGHSLSAIWTVPRNHRGFVLAINSGVWRNGAPQGAMASGRLVVTSGIDTPNPVDFVEFNYGVAAEGGDMDREFRRPLVISGPADVRVDCTLLTDNNVIMSAGFSLYYEPAV